VCFLLAARLMLAMNVLVFFNSTDDLEFKNFVLQFLAMILSVFFC
jgi:hypothetical protein